MANHEESDNRLPCSLSHQFLRQLIVSRQKGISALKAIGQKGISVLKAIDHLCGEASWSLNRN
jgi:hypothetical protein